MPEPLIQSLAELPTAEPDPVRAAQVRGRCRARLKRQAARQPTSRAPVPRGKMQPLWQPLIAALGVAYLTEVVVEAIRFYGLFLD